MTEPLLVYKKGEGWVYSAFDTLDFQWRGKTLRLEARRPEIGERFEWVFSDTGIDDWIRRDRTPILERFKAYLLGETKLRQAWRDVNRYYEDGVYVTIIEVT